eukprot:m51a1_g4711 hypothetical protein (320) ;mRNA; r:291759-293132
MSYSVERCVEQLLLRCEPLEPAVLADICEKLKEILVNEPNVVSVSSPLTIVGNLHAQFSDLLELFRTGGMCPDTNYLFLGDYADFWMYGVETVQLLLCLRLRYPSRITLLRGEHETRTVSAIYGLYSECLRKYGDVGVWECLCDLYDYLPMGALVDNTVFAVHGGIPSPPPSAPVVCLDQIRVQDRFQEVPREGVLTELLWNDPTADREGFTRSQRGVGLMYGPDVLAKFAAANGLARVVRAHQLCMGGFAVQGAGLLTTVWSAPNCAGRCGNVGAVVEVADDCSLFCNTFLAAPEALQRRPSPDPLVEPFRAVPQYYL